MTNYGYIFIVKNTKDSAMYITEKRTQLSHYVLSNPEIEGLNRAHEVQARFKDKNSCFKAILNIFCASAISTFTYILEHCSKLYITKEVLQFFLQIGSFQFFLQIGSQRIK